MLAALAAAAPAAQAADLLLLDSEQQTVSGNLNYGFVYVDGELRLSGDTTITAASIYFGPNAGLRTCFVEGSGNGGCTAGRSLTLRSAGPLAVSSGIDLTAGHRHRAQRRDAHPPGRRRSRSAATSTRPEAAAAAPAASRSRRPGPLSVGAIYAYGAGGEPLGRRRDRRRRRHPDPGHGTASRSPTPARVQSGGPVSLTSTGGDVRIAGNISSWGRDAPASAGAGLAGGKGADITISGSDVRTASLDSTGGNSADSVGGGVRPHHARARAARCTRSGASTPADTNSTLSQATPGAPISATAGGSLVLAGGACDRRRPGLRRRHARRRHRRAGPDRHDRHPVRGGRQRSELGHARRRRPAAARSP